MNPLHRAGSTDEYLQLLTTTFKPRQAGLAKAFEE